MNEDQSPTKSISGAVASIALDHTVPTDTQGVEPWLCSANGLRFRLLQVQHSYSPVKSMKYCQRVSIPNTNPSYDHNGLHGVISCNNSLCTVCGNRKEERNIAILDNVIRNTNQDYDYYLVTLTFSTNCQVSEQASSMQTAYSLFVKNIRRKFDYIGASIETSWSNDITVDTETFKCHLHRHCLTRVPKGTKACVASIMEQAWIRTVRKHTNRDALAIAFDCKAVDDSAGAIAYVYKTAREMAANSGKDTHHTNRVGWLRLLELIQEGREDLIAVYQKIVDAMKGKRWFGLSLKMKADYVEEEEITSLETTEQEERFITVIEGTPQIHNAIDYGGALYTLRCVLATNTDGDKDIEAFRTLVDKWRPILHRDNEDTRLIDKAAEEFYNWALSTSCGLV